MFDVRLCAGGSSFIKRAPPAPPLLIQILPRALCRRRRGNRQAAGAAPSSPASSSFSSAVLCPRLPPSLQPCAYLTYFIPIPVRVFVYCVLLTVRRRRRRQLARCSRCIPPPFAPLHAITCCSVVACARVTVAPHGVSLTPTCPAAAARGRRRRGLREDCDEA
jgi:hypothetical protein